MNDRPRDHDSAMGASPTSPPEAPGSDRIDAVLSAMAANDVDVVALAPSDNLSYVLGFSPLPDERLCLLLLSERGAIFVVPALNAEQSASHIPGLELLRWADGEGFEQALRAGLASPPREPGAWPPTR